MNWMRWAGAAAALLLLSGCVYGYRMIRTEVRYSASARPESSYYCYDCHGYRYFDPYYDWCTSFGFRYSWTRHPQAIALYRQRYVRIRQQHPDYGRYRYPSGYRNSERYREPRSYEAWRGERRRSGGADVEQPPGRGSRRDAEPREKPRIKDGHGDKKKGRDDGHERRDGTRPRERGARDPVPEGVES